MGHTAETAFEWVKTDRKTVQLKIRPDGTLQVRTPKRMSRRAVERLVAEHADWIFDARRAVAARPPEPSDEQLAVWRKQAADILPPLVAQYAAQMGLTPAGVGITAARTRWGSCSPAGRLNFSCRLMAYPQAAAEAVVVHELAHLRHRNHGAAFYALVREVLPDYDARIRLLKPGGSDK